MYHKYIKYIGWECTGTNLQRQMYQMYQMDETQLSRQMGFLEKPFWPPGGVAEQ